MHWLSFMKDLWAYLGTRKKFWLLPIMLILLLFGLLIMFTEGSALSSFIYILF